MRDHERTQLSYVAQALVRAPRDDWELILDDAKRGASASASFVKALKALRRSIQRHRDLRLVTRELLESSDPEAVLAGRTLAWSWEQVSSSPPPPVSSL